MAALTAMTLQRGDPCLRRQTQAAGKAYKVVATACMRKLLVILNTMLRNNSQMAKQKLLKNRLTNNTAARW